MRIGVPKEIKNHEYRVGMTPPGVLELTSRGHEIIIQHDAGHQIGIDDDHYRAAGARIGEDAEIVFAEADIDDYAIVVGKADAAPHSAEEAFVHYFALTLAPREQQNLSEVVEVNV